MRLANICFSASSFSFHPFNKDVHRAKGFIRDEVQLPNFPLKDRAFHGKSKNSLQF